MVVYRGRKPAGSCSPCAKDLVSSRPGIIVSGALANKPLNEGFLERPSPLRCPCSLKAALPPSPNRLRQVGLCARTTAPYFAAIPVSDAFADCRTDTAVGLEVEASNWSITASRSWICASGPRGRL